MSEHTTPADPQQVTLLLNAAVGGDAKAANELLPLVYNELRKLAGSRMAGERDGGAGQTLQPTALVHEAYMRLVGDGDVKWNGRGHFFAAAAQAMRRILVDRARARNALKRGGGAARAMIDPDQLAGEPGSDEMLSLDDALTALEAYDKRKHEVVMLRYFTGLSLEDTAKALDVSLATVKNDWAFARAWLKRYINGEGAKGGDAG